MAAGQDLRGADVSGDDLSAEASQGCCAEHHLAQRPGRGNRLDQRWVKFHRPVDPIAHWPVGQPFRTEEVDSVADGLVIGQTYSDDRFTQSISLFLIPQ